jgi:T5SS/PEP-CTERM-associated repeat protein
MLKNTKLLGMLIVIALIAAAVHPAAGGVVLVGDYVDNIAQDYLMIGETGLGGMTITDAGEKSSPYGYLGFGFGSVGIARVNGANSKWTSSTIFIVGYNGSGTLVVENGGLVSCAKSYVSYGNNTDGTVTVDGAGSKWTNTGSVYVSYNSNSIYGGGVVNINNGGLMQVGGTLNVWRTGQVHVNNGQLIVGGLETYDKVTTAVDGILTLNKTTVTVQPGRPFSVGGRLGFTNGAGIVLNNSQLIHSMQQLDLQGAGITGQGEIFVGSAGLNLGSAANQGSLDGTSETERLTVYGHISGSGSMNNVTVFGNVSVGNSTGEIVTDNVSLASSGTVTMELGGLAPGTGHDQIVVNGALALGGGLNVEWYDKFQAAKGDSFTLFDLSSAADMTGTFNTENFPTFTDPNLFWSTADLYTTGEITVAPEPATMILLSASGLIVLRRRKS